MKKIILLALTAVISESYCSTTEYMDYSESRASGLSVSIKRQSYFLKVNVTKEKTSYSHEFSLGDLQNMNDIVIESHVDRILNQAQDSTVLTSTQKELLQLLAKDESQCPKIATYLYKSSRTPPSSPERDVYNEPTWGY